MAVERNLVIYADDADELANYLKTFGVQLKQEGVNPSHWCVEQGNDMLHVCEERRHTMSHKSDDPGTHGLWNFIKHHRLSTADEERLI